MGIVLMNAKESFRRKHFSKMGGGYIKPQYTSLEPTNALKYESLK